MAFCENCGAQINDGAKFCPSCGKAVDQDQSNQQSQANGSQNTSAQDSQENKVMAVLAYILFFIPLIAGTYKTSPFVKYHTNQGTVLFVAAAIWGIVYGILTAIFTALAFIPGFWIISTIVFAAGGLICLVPLAFAIVGIVNAVQGKCSPLPVIGKYELIK